MKTTLTINQIIDEWLANSDVLPLTKVSYRNKTNLWFRYLLKMNIDPRSPKCADVLDYKHHLEGKGYSQLTVGGYITAVKLFYAYCESVRYCENIAAGIRCVPKHYTHRKQALTIDQANALLESIDMETIKGKRDKLIIALMLFNGLRTCEVQRIDICDFDVRDDLYLLVIQRKGRREKSEVISVEAEIMELFEDYTACRNFNPSDPLFISHCKKDHGGRLTRITISNIVKARLRGIGIDTPSVTAHSLRHTYGAILVEQGEDIENIREGMGHTSATTTRIYIAEAQRRRLIKNNLSQHIINALERAKITAENTSVV